MSAGILRPLVHAAVLGFVFCEPSLGKWGMAAVAGGAVLANAFLLPLTPLGRALRREGEPRFGGLVTYPLAVAAGYLLFRPEVAGLAWAILAIGDPAAALVGSRLPAGPRYPWNRRKSLAGSAAFLLAGWAAAAGFLAATSVTAELNGPTLVFLGILALAGTIAETLPIPPDDNLPILLAAGGTGAALEALLAGSH